MKKVYFKNVLFYVLMFVLLFILDISLREWSGRTDFHHFNLLAHVVCIVGITGILVVLDYGLTKVKRRNK